MRKLLRMFVMFAVIFMITGCVKVEFSMGIHNDKSMDLKIVEAVDQSLMEGDDSGFDTNSIFKAEDVGFLVREYTDGSLKGYQFTKTFNNIDVLSTVESNYVSDLNLLFEESNVTLFTIKRGFLKNHYVAKFDISGSDLGKDFDSDMNNEVGDFSFDFNSSLNNDLGKDFDYSQLMSNIEMNFIVNLPYKAINSNATSIDNNGKQLTWNLISMQNETINFEFELYNMTNVYIVIGISLIVFVLIIAVIVKMIKGNGSSSNGQIKSNNNQQNHYMNTVSNTNYTDSNMSNSNASSFSFLPNDNSNSFLSQNDNLTNSADLYSQSFNSFSSIQNSEMNNSISQQDVPINEVNQANNGYLDNSNNMSNSLLSDLASINYNNSIDNTYEQQSSFQPQSQISAQNFTQSQSQATDLSTFNPVNLEQDNSLIQNSSNNDNNNNNNFFQGSNNF